MQTISKVGLYVVPSTSPDSHSRINDIQYLVRTYDGPWSVLCNPCSAYKNWVRSQLQTPRLLLPIFESCSYTVSQCLSLFLLTSYSVVQPNTPSLYYRVIMGGHSQTQATFEQVRQELYVQLYTSANRLLANVSLSSRFNTWSLFPTKARRNTKQYHL